MSSGVQNIAINTLVESTQTFNIQRCVSLSFRGSVSTNTENFSFIAHLSLDKLIFSVI